jgi:endonuclease V-like protein UPF0215 family
MHLEKKGIRVLGIAESFNRAQEQSVLAGIVMRADLLIDGVAFSHATVGGMDATAAVLRLVSSLERADINLLLLNGCVISWFNIIDLNEVHHQLQLPLICVTYEASEGLEAHIAKHFAGGERDSRLEAYRRLNQRAPLQLRSQYTVFIRCLGITPAEAEAVLNKFTLQGKLPEPVRVAKLVARAQLLANAATTNRPVR